MVISRLIGGLGNQMFQYACGRALAEHHRVPLKVDLRGFRKYKLHQCLLNQFLITGETTRFFELPNFAITSQAASDQKWPRSVRLGPWFLNWFPSRLWRQGYRVVSERSLRYDPTVQDQGPNIYLDGYWQSEKYFIDIREVLLREFQLRQAPATDNQRLAQKMSSVHSVALHVRRADYVANPLYATCTPSYYQRAVAAIAERQPNIHIFVFSDDPAWVKQNIQFAFPTEYVTNNVGRANYLDLWLMTHCQYSVIANSSFSWWGAWLKTRTDGFVIAPQTWYTDPSKDTSDLLPPSWVKLPV